MESSQLKENLDKVLEEIGVAARKAGRSDGDVSLVAVSKTHSAEMVAELYKVGQAAFGENYVQEAMDKMDELRELDIKWHFIGHLQSNKAKQVAGRFDMIETVHSLKVAERLNKAVEEQGWTQPVLIQVNLGGEDQKSGVAEDGLLQLSARTEEMKGLDLQGLMVLPPFLGDGEKTRPYFVKLRRLKADLEKRLGRSLPHLSMGMTADFVQAIEEGATLVRVGTRIFGPREYC